MNERQWLGKLRKAMESWAQLLRILKQVGANSHVSGMFFKAVV